MKSAVRKPLVSADQISGEILVLRGRRVILDRALARIYGVEVRTLNQAVKRNAERFPEDFRFQLTSAEAAALRSQTVILESGGTSEAGTTGVLILIADACGKRFVLSVA